MLELKIGTFDTKGVEVFTPWVFTPIDIELQIIREGEEGTSTSGTEQGETIYGKASYIVTIGAGTLRKEEAKKALLQLCFFNSIQWKFTKKTKTEWRRFVARFDKKIVFEYLEGRRSLPKLKVTLIEEKAHFTRGIQTFIDELTEQWQQI